MPWVSLTQFRSEHAKWVEHARRRSEAVILTSHGREVVALVSMEDLKLLWNAQDERRYGPINPTSGRPFGRQWVLDHFQGHYERHRDPEAYMHPSREAAPWLGRPFEWPRGESGQNAVPRLTEATAAADPPRRWWRFWAWMTAAM